MSTKIPKSHPRYESLMMREKLAKGFDEGFVHETGLIAHGRGEAFDYLLGERTIPVADTASKVAAALLLLAKHPVISVNGNVVALVAEDIVSLSKCVPAWIEVNLFHRTDDRISRLVSRMEEAGGNAILGVHASARIDGLAHDRGWCEKEGIFSSDVVLVPLEDGDRCQALRKMGKTVVTIDLNPLSRTAKTAQVTIVDNVVRAIPRIRFWVEQLKNESNDVLQTIFDDWDNEQALEEVLSVICSRFQKD